jgi:hypothetical protein
MKNLINHPSLPNLQRFLLRYWSLRHLPSSLLRPLISLNVAPPHLLPNHPSLSTFPF